MSLCSNLPPIDPVCKNMWSLWPIYNFMDTLIFDQPAAACMIAVNESHMKSVSIICSRAQSTDCLLTVQLLLLRAPALLFKKFSLCGDKTSTSTSAIIQLVSLPGRLCCSRQNTAWHRKPVHSWECVTPANTVRRLKMASWQQIRRRCEYCGWWMKTQGDRRHAVTRHAL